MQNGFCESFNGRMGDELLNETLSSITPALGSRIGLTIIAASICFCEKTRTHKGVRAIFLGALSIGYSRYKERRSIKVMLRAGVQTLAIVDLRAATRLGSPRICIDSGG